MGQFENALTWEGGPSGPTRALMKTFLQRSTATDKHGICFQKAGRWNIITEGLTTEGEEVLLEFGSEAGRTFGTKISEDAVPPGVRQALQVSRPVDESTASQTWNIEASRIKGTRGISYTVMDPVGIENPRQFQGIDALQEGLVELENEFRGKQVNGGPSLSMCRALNGKVKEGPIEAILSELGLWTFRARRKQDEQDGLWIIGPGTVTGQHFPDVDMGSEMDV